MDLQQALANEALITAVRQTVFDSEYPISEDSYGSPSFSKDDLLHATCLVRAVVMKEAGRVTSRIAPHKATQKSYCIPNPEIEDLLAQIRKKGAIKPHSAYPKCVFDAVFAPAISSDLQAACIRDGLRMSRDSIVRIFQGESPDTPTGILVQAAIAFARKYEDGRCEQNESVQLQDVCSSLMQADSDMPYFPSKRPFSTYNTRSSGPNGIINSRVAYRSSSKTDLGSFIDNFESSDNLWEFYPFPKWNGLIEWVLRMIYTQRMRLPLLKYVALSKCMFEWERGILSFPHVLFAYGEGSRTTPNGTDSTPFFQQVFTFMNEGLETLLVEANAQLARIEKLKERISDCERFNLRQVVFLNEWLEGGTSAAVTVEDYAKQFAVTANTARQDLKTLTSIGLCHMRYAGKAEEYMRNPSFDIVVESLLA